MVKMAKRRRAKQDKPARLLAMDTTADVQRELVGTVEAAEILGLRTEYVRQLARDGEIWSDHRFGQRCPVYDAIELRERAARMAAERAAGKRPGRPPHSDA